MAEESSATSHLPVAMTTVQVTGATAVTSPSSRGADFYFGCAVIMIGVVGTAANAVVLYAMVASKQHRKHVLILNQNILDFIGSVFLGVTYALKISDIYLRGSLGYWLCMMLVSENLLWCALEASGFEDMSARACSQITERNVDPVLTIDTAIDISFARPPNQRSWINSGAHSKPPCSTLPSSPSTAI